MQIYFKKFSSKKACELKRFVYGPDGRQQRPLGGGVAESVELPADGGGDPEGVPEEAVAERRLVNRSQARGNMNR